MDKISRPSAILIPPRTVKKKRKESKKLNNWTYVQWIDQGMQRAEVMIKGPGLGRDAALRAIRRSGILLRFIRDVTPMPHNGCRSPKKRRV